MRIARIVLATALAAGTVTQSTSPHVITHGVDMHSETYQTVGGAERAQVMNVDLTDPNVRFGAVEAGDKLVDPSDETISSMANRTGAVAGVNSDFFAINATGQPMGMVVQNRVLEASPVSSWPYDLEVLTSGQVQMATETFTGTADDTTTGSTRKLVALNRIDQTGLTWSSTRRRRPWRPLRGRPGGAVLAAAAGHPTYTAIPHNPSWLRYTGNPLTDTGVDSRYRLRVPGAAVVRVALPRRCGQPRDRPGR